MSGIETKRTRVAVSEFKAHCTEYLASVETGREEIEITRHGKVIAIATAPDFDKTSRPLLGAGRDSAVLNESYDPHAPAWEEDDWELNAE
jgi:prevent-host-death family protein